MNSPVANYEVSDSDENLPKGVTPECFNRGSIPISPGFPIDAFGNDGLQEV